jgi:HEPN domain-containing protein
MREKNLRCEAERWYTQAKDDIEAASLLSASKKYAPTCFWSQQAAEKAIKAVCYLLDLRPQGHSCTRLIQSLPEDERLAFEDVIDTALSLEWA